MIPIEVLADTKLKHRVAQKLQPFVMCLVLAVSFDKRGMRQRRFQQGTVEKRIPQVFFQNGKRVFKYRHAIFL
jgi:hypothetical protein